MCQTAENYLPQGTQSTHLHIYAVKQTYTYADIRVIVRTFIECAFT